MKQTLLFIFLVSFLSVNSQSFETKITEIQDLLQNVKGAKKEMMQSIEQTEPNVIKITIEMITNKGKTTTNSYEFSPSDIDINTINSSAKKDFVYVQLLAKGKQKMIKMLKENNSISYVNKLLVVATDIKNGRALATKFKELVPIAKTIVENRLNLTTYEDYQQWLLNNVGNVVLPKKQINQKIEFITDYHGKIAISKEIITKKSLGVNLYQLNLMNLNPRAILFEVAGSQFNVVLKTNERFINQAVDGVHKSFINKVKIAFESIEKARDFQKVIIDLIEISKGLFNKNLPNVSTVKQGLELTNSKIVELKNANLNITQIIEGDCVLHLNQSIEKSGKINNNEFFLNLIDLNNNDIKISTEKGFYKLKLFTLASNKYIKALINQEQVNYRKDIILYINSIEDAILLKKTFESIISICNGQNSNKNTTYNATSLIEALTASVQNISINNVSYEQEFSLGEESLLNFKRTTITEKASTEELYECYLSDLSFRNLEFKTSGKKVYVNLKSNNLEKLIKYYKGGEIKNYQNTIKIEASTIENARDLVKLFSKLIENNQ